MTETVAGFRFWELRFDANGHPVGGVDALLAELPRTGVQDLFVMAHGWNNAPDRARRLYERFFGEIGALLPPRDAVATVGVIWPSMRWPDEGDPEADTDSGGAVSLSRAAMSERELVASLKAVFPRQDDVLDELGALLDERPDAPAALARFQTLAGRLAGERDATDADEDNPERFLLEGLPEQVFARSARQALARAGESDLGGAAMLDAGGAASMGANRLWDGAKQVLRQTSYWEMKKRAGRVGTFGLGPTLTQLSAVAPKLRVHLIGHSFGARLVSFTLQGLGDDPPLPTLVKSVLLVQGAFSHYAFADSLPHAPERSGWLAGMQRRVDGPLVVTHSVYDLAVGRMYPAASAPAGQDAADFSDWMQRWGAIGRDGAQAVGARLAALGPSRTTYDLRDGQFLNLDGDAVIRRGRPPSGAHSDIFHPEIAWAAVTAARLAPD